MPISRRTLLKGALAGAAAAPAIGHGFGRAAWAADGKIKVGGIMDVSGQGGFRSKANILRLAVEETNAAGGLLGRQVDLIQYDTQSNNQLYAQYGHQLVLNDKVSVVIGGITSAAREVLRPILDHAKTPYFYTTEYEGGVCDRNTFLTGATISQSLGTMMPYLTKRFGKKVYVLGPDYVFGQLSEKWIRKYMADHGGGVVGAELFPLDAANFSSTISKIQSAAPDFIIDSFVTPPQMSFYGQWMASGMKAKIPIASQVFGNSGQNLQTPKEVSEGIICCFSYYQEIDNPANRAFVKKFHERFHNDDYLGDIVISDYIAWKLYAEAVEKAGTIAREPVLKALESGLTVTTPGSIVRLDPRLHHCIFDMHLLEIHNGGFRLLETVNNVAPHEMDGRCDLVKNPRTNKQFAPQI